MVRDTNNVLGFFNTLSNYYGIIPMAQLFHADSLAVNIFPTLPVTFAGAYYPRYEDLVYVDISLLFSVQLTITNHQCQISWDTTTGKTNIVEYSTVMPPAWNTLLTTNGNGSRYTITDPSVINGRRFYRVKVN